MPLPPKLCEIMAAHADGQPKGWNRRICEEMGFGTSEWCRWMKGRHQPNADTVIQILWKLGELENFKPDALPSPSGASEGAAGVEGAEMQEKR